jgi:hypothetical protein
MLGLMKGEFIMFIVEILSSAMMLLPSLMAVRGI